MKKNFDIIVIGGGLVGAAVACGVARKGSNVAILDGGDRDYRASRGNFGLVWVQGKGYQYAPYAKWTGLSARKYPDLDQIIKDSTGLDIDLVQKGGIDICLTEQEWDQRLEMMTAVRRYTNGGFRSQMLDYVELHQLIPQISDEVVGASFSPQDGHLNPLALLRGLLTCTQNSGGSYLADQKVVSIKPSGNEFEVTTNHGVFGCAQVVLCAGLDNKRLASDLGMNIPVYPVRGQLLITERVSPFLNLPSVQVRQTHEGTLQIGDSHEEVGLNDGTTLDVIGEIAKRAVTIFPHLKDVKLNRAWGALRIMTGDGFPIYHQSNAYPGAYSLSCHSGVTLAAMHAGAITDWIVDGDVHPLIPYFSADRFNVPGI